MAYLTQANYKKLCKTLNINDEISLELFLENIYPDSLVYNILTKREVKEIFIMKMLSTDASSFVLHYYVEVPEQEDSLEMVFNTGGKTKYHTIYECPFLSKDYIDAKIPEDIFTRGTEAVDEYRGWFRNNNFLERLVKNEITKREIIRSYNLIFPKKFGFEPLSENSQILIVQIPNSQDKGLNQNFDLNYFEEELKKLKNEYTYAFQSPIARKIAKFKHLTNRSINEIIDSMSHYFTPNFIDNYGIEKLRQKWETSRKINEQIMELLENYIKWTVGLKYYKVESVYLEIFGLECCSYCKKNDQNRTSDNPLSPGC